MLRLKRTTEKKIFHSSGSTFVLFLGSFFLCLNKTHIFRLLSSLFFIAMGHPGSMYANRERWSIQNGYSYMQCGRKSHDMWIYGSTHLHSLFLCFGSTDDLFQIRNLVIQMKTLMFRSKTMNVDQNTRYQIHNFEITGPLHISFLYISRVIHSIS